MREKKNPNSAERLYKFFIYLFFSQKVFTLYLYLNHTFTADNLITNYHEANDNLFTTDLPRFGNGRITVRLRLGGDRRSQDIL